MAATNSTLWSVQRDVILGSTNVNSDYPPQIIGVGSRIYCFYVQQGTQRLSYCILDRTPADTWKASGGTDSIRIPATAVSPEIATDTPALAYHGGLIHVIYPDANKRLLHIRLNPGNGVFGKRYALGFESGIPPAVTVFKDKLFCVTTLQPQATNIGKFIIQTWDRDNGWYLHHDSQFKDNQITSPVALFELEGKLHIYFVQDSEGVDTPGTIWHFEYDGNPGSEWNRSPISSPPIPSGTGVSGCTVISMGFLVYFDSHLPVVDGKLNIIQLPATTLDIYTTSTQAAPTHQSFVALVKNNPNMNHPVVPRLRTVGNTLMCIWSDRETGGLKYTTRRVLPMPPLNAWMTDLPSDWFISQLTIPGTHDSAAISNIPVVGTQTLDISAQLKSGIRYFDIRAGFDEETDFITNFTDEQRAEKLISYHGPVAIRTGSYIFLDYLYISDIFEACYKFLADNEGECILLQIKQDQYKLPSDREKTLFADAMMALIKAAPLVGKQKSSPWRMENTMPKLGDLRGKIQLVRRFDSIKVDLDKAGIDVVTHWPKPEDGEKKKDGKEIEHGVDTKKGFGLSIQDKFDWGANVSVCEEKFELVKSYIKKKTRRFRAMGWSINYASAIALKFPLYPFTAPRVARGWSWGVTSSPGVNKMLAGVFNDEAHKMGHGTIVLDFCETPGELLLGMIRTNYQDIPGAQG